MPEASVRATPISPKTLEGAIAAATDALLAVQRPDGHWVFELEADATIPAEYVLMRHYLAEPVDAELEAKIARYLRRIQGEHGGWPLFHDGQFDMSASVKAYFALKMIGDDVEAPHMRRAREAIRSRGGGAEQSQRLHPRACWLCSVSSAGSAVSGHAVVEIMLLPRWFPFHLDKISYWARTGLIRAAAGARRAEAGRSQSQAESASTSCFSRRRKPSGMLAKAPHQTFAGWFRFFRTVDARSSASIEPRFPAAMRKARHRQGRRGFCDEAAERRGWARRDFSRDGQHVS